MMPRGLLTLEALAFASQVRAAQRAQVKDKSYRATPIGGEVGRFLRALRWSDASQNTLDSYETTLSRLAYDFAHRELSELETEDLRGFLDEHWGEAAAATRRQRLAAVKSFYRWAIEERDLAANPIEKVKPPRRTSIERQAYTPDLVDRLRDAQPSLRDQIGVQLLGRLGLRRNELRLVQIADFERARATLRVHGKGGKIAVMPLGFRVLKRDLEVHVVGRGGEEYLIHPKRDVTRPMSPAGIHYWFKRCLDRAGLPASVKLHELRHSAADNLWRRSGNLTLAQKLLRHDSPATTAGYLHPLLDDLEAALEALDE
jgi:site-specific recombinase XerD